MIYATKHILIEILVRLPCHLICKSPSDYISLDIRKGVSIYRQFEKNPETFLYVPNPALKTEVWRDFEP